MLKGDRFVRGPSFFSPLEEAMFKHRQMNRLNIIKRIKNIHIKYIFFYISSRATLMRPRLNIIAFCPEHPNCDKNPKFTFLSETTSIPAFFICEPLPSPLPWGLNALGMEIKCCFQRIVGGQCSQDKRSGAKRKGALTI